MDQAEQLMYWAAGHIYTNGNLYMSSPVIHEVNKFYTTVIELQLFFQEYLIINQN